MSTDTYTSLVKVEFSSGYCIQYTEDLNVAGDPLAQQASQIKQMKLAKDHENMNEPKKFIIAGHHIGWTKKIIEWTISNQNVTLAKYLWPRAAYILSTAIYLNYNWNYFLLSQRRSTQDILYLEGSKIQDLKIHHILYQQCVEPTYQLFYMLVLQGAAPFLAVELIS